MSMSNSSSNSNGMFSMNNDTGMIVSLTTMTRQQKIDVMNRLLHNLIVPTSNVMNLLGDKAISSSNLSMVMNVFQSINMDCKIYDLTILKDNPNTAMFKKCYDRNGFYMISASPVADKQHHNEIIILFELYKNPLVDPVKFMDQVRSANGEMLAYFYIKELVSLAQKNYRNKFSLANRAKLYLWEHFPKMDSAIRDEAAIALTKVAMEFHINSMLIDNMNTNGTSMVFKNISNLRDSMLVMYSEDERFRYPKTQLEILNELLPDANIELLSSSNTSNATNNGIPQIGQDDSESNDQSSDQESNEDEGINRSSAYSNWSEDDNALSESSDDGNIDENSSSNEDDDSNANGVPSTDDGQMLKITFKSNPSQIFFGKMPPQKADPRYDSLDSMDERKIHSVQKQIDHTLGKMRGSGIGELLTNIGSPIQINTEWTKYIKQYITNKNSMCNSDQKEATWSKRNNYTAHMAVTPGRKDIPRSYPNIYVMFDQSGSISDNVVRQINYLIQFFYERKYNIKVMIHDYDQEADDVEVHEFNTGSLIPTSDVSIDDLITSRFRNGGTSHKGVFDLMEEYIDYVTETDKRYNNHYVLICSDMYSDIEDIYANYKWIKLLGNNVMGLTPERDGGQLPFGQTIVIE